MSVGGDPYRWYLTPEDLANTDWNDGPPNYDIVNKLFTEERTNVWPAGSLEEYVQSFVKTWEMELVHKANPDQFKTVDPKKFVAVVNVPCSCREEVFHIGGYRKDRGSYNLFLQTSLPPEYRFYDPDQETYESSQSTFKTVFPRGFAVEILQVYSGPPVIAYKFRHWGYFEGAYKDIAPTGEKIEFFGITIFELNEDKKVVKVEFFHDRGELLADILKGKPSGESSASVPTLGCPFFA